MARHRKSGYLGRGGSVKGMPPAPNPSSYHSANQYGSVVAGTGNQQFSRVFEHGHHGNAITGAQGQLSVVPAYKGGRSRTKRKRGGIFGAVIDQAIVPFGILALQNAYGRKSRSGSKKYHKKRFTKKRSFRRY
jgi:hypothetical protein